MQPDSIIPDQTNPQSWNRMSYVRNNPILFNDPTGHMESCEDGDVCRHPTTSPPSVILKIKKDAEENSDELSLNEIGLKLEDYANELDSDPVYNGFRDVGIYGVTAATGAGVTALACIIITGGLCALPVLVGGGFVAGVFAGSYVDEKVSHPGDIYREISRQIEYASTRTSGETSLTITFTHIEGGYVSSATEVPERFRNNNPLTIDSAQYSPERYELHIQGSNKVIVLTPEEAEIVNNFFGGLLFP